MDIIPIIVVLLIGMVSAIIGIYLSRQKVINYVWSKFGEVENLKVKWTLAGPFAPGKGNSKFYVAFIDKNGKSHHYFAVSSLFGDVFLREGKEVPFDR